MRVCVCTLHTDAYVDWTRPASSYLNTNVALTDTLYNGVIFVMDSLERRSVVCGMSEGATADGHCRIMCLAAGCRLAVIDTSNAVDATVRRNYMITTWDGAS